MQTNKNLQQDEIWQLIQTMRIRQQKIKYLFHSQDSPPPKIMYEFNYKQLYKKSMCKHTDFINNKYPVGTILYTQMFWCPRVYYRVKSHTKHTMRLQCLVQKVCPYYRGNGIPLPTLKSRHRSQDVTAIMRFHNWSVQNLDLHCWFVPNFPHQIQQQPRQCRSCLCSFGSGNQLHQHLNKYPSHVQDCMNCDIDIYDNSI